MEGPGDNPDPHLARIRDTEPTSPVEFSRLTRAIPIADPHAPIAPWGRDTARGIDSQSARGEMWGDEVGDTNGQADEHQRSSHGGAKKRFEVDQFDSGVPRVIHTGAVIEGALRASEMLTPMMNTHVMAAECYRLSLEKEPHLSANMVLVFEVLPLGKVVDVEVAGQFEGLNSPQPSPVVSDLKLCLREGLNSIEFPLRSGASRIKYPLSFSAPHQRAVRHRSL